MRVGVLCGKEERKDHKWGSYLMACWILNSLTSFQKWNTTEYEYVVASACYSQVIWMQLKLLNNGLNFLTLLLFMMLMLIFNCPKAKFFLKPISCLWDFLRWCVTRTEISFQFYLVFLIFFHFSFDNLLGSDMNISVKRQSEIRVMHWN